jgi:hypothetical protein
MDLLILTISGGRDPPVLLHTGCQLAKSGAFIVNEKEDLSPELKEFIDQLIVPLLVEQLMQQGHLYHAGESQYDANEPLPEAIDRERRVPVIGAFWERTVIRWLAIHERQMAAGRPDRAGGRSGNRGHSSNRVCARRR